MWRLTVDDNCVSSGSCTAIVPSRFQFGADHKSHPVTPEAEADEAILDAALSCPVEAITVVDAESGDIVAP